MLVDQVARLVLTARRLKLFEGGAVKVYHGEAVAFVATIDSIERRVDGKITIAPKWGIVQSPLFTNWLTATTIQLTFSLVDTVLDEAEGILIISPRGGGPHSIMLIPK